MMGKWVTVFVVGMTTIESGSILITGGGTRRNDARFLERQHAYRSEYMVG